MKTVNRNDVEDLLRQVELRVTRSKQEKAMEELRTIFKATDCCGNCFKYQTILCACTNVVDADYPAPYQWCQAHVYDSRTREQRYTIEQKELSRREKK